MNEIVRLCTVVGTVWSRHIVIQAEILKQISEITIKYQGSPLLYKKPTDTRYTMVRVHGMLQSAKIHYHTRTRITHGVGTVGLPVPVQKPRYHTTIKVAPSLCIIQTSSINKEELCKSAIFVGRGMGMGILHPLGWISCR